MEENEKIQYMLISYLLVVYKINLNNLSKMYQNVSFYYKILKQNETF